ncbi:alpha/beta hydrolase family protein [Kitasatospora sp. NPDC088346]|uniref:alpha/beta hydrolase family protein n=1 Tax=Kitasatospora sp. NPDC088346 TaxID=3364073 RepID=UPI00382BA637
MARRLVLTCVAALLVALGLGGVAVYENDYRIREQRVTVTHDGRTLDGVLALPKGGRGPYGLVVFVHGDGPIDATHDTFYRPIWEALAEAGYASLSWNKPGVGGSPGDWLGQSMDDRARETEDAVAWARSRPEIDGRRIGLWGASQAGWVLPKVAAHDPAPAFVIAVSPAIAWATQGRYDLLAELSDRGASAEETAAAVRRQQVRGELMDRGASFEEFRAAVGGELDGFTPARWGFAARNHTADATADLRAVRGTPVLLLLAGQDRHVDVAETEAVYRSVLPAGSLEVRHYPDATHSLVTPDIERSEVSAVLTAVFAPRSLFADGFLADQREFVARY